MFLAYSEPLLLRLLRMNGSWEIGRLGNKFDSIPLVYMMSLASDLLLKRVANGIKGFASVSN